MKYRNVWEYQEEERKFSPIFLQFSIIIKNSKHFIYLILSKLLLTRIAQTATPAIFTIHLMACNASSIANFFLFFFFFFPHSLCLLFNNAVAQSLLSLAGLHTSYGSHSKLAIYQWHGSPYKRIDQWYNAYAISRPRVQNWNTIYTKFEDAFIPALI